MTIKVSKIEEHLKELNENLKKVLDKLAEVEKAREDLSIRRYALIGAIESTNVIKKSIESDSAEPEKESSEEK